MLALLFVTAAWMGALRVQQSFVYARWFDQYPPGPWYTGATGAVWAVGALTVAVGLLFGWRWAPRAARAAAVIGAAGWWLDKLLLTRSPLARTGWPFALGLTLFILLFVFSALALPAQQLFFSGGRDERT